MMTSYNKILFLSEVRGIDLLQSGAKMQWGLIYEKCLYSKILPKSRKSRRLNICCYEMENLAISKV